MAAAGHPWTDSAVSFKYEEHVQHVRYALVALRGTDHRIEPEKIENHKQYAKRWMSLLSYAPGLR